MDNLVKEKYKEKLGYIKDLVKDSNYYGCLRKMTDMTKASLLLDYTDGVFISEFFEWLFDNLNDIDDTHDIEKSDKEKINKTIMEVIDLLIKSFPIEDTNKIKIVDAMRDTRYEVTKLQAKYWVQKPKGARILRER